jgi:hypothetical protein
LTNGRVCSYDTNVKKRGLPEGYVRGLEKLWGLAIRDVEAIEDQMLVALAGNEESKPTGIGRRVVVDSNQVNVARDLGKHRTFLSLPSMLYQHPLPHHSLPLWIIMLILSGSETPLNIWNNESISEALVETWRKSTMSKELERLLSSQEPTIETKRKRAGSDLQAPKRADRMSFSQSSIAAKDASQARPDFSASRWPEFGHDGKTSHEFSRPPNSSHSYVSSVCLLF